jgi:transposase
MQEYCVGLDVHSRDCVYAIQDEPGTLIGEGSVPTTVEGLLGLRNRYELPAGTMVGLETGTMAFYVARVLQRMGLVPLVIDAHEVRIKAHRPTQKSDRRDAREICEGVRRGQYRAIVHVPPERISALRDTLARRRHFVRLQTAEVNAVKRLLRAAGLGALTRRSLRTEVGWDRLHVALSGEASLQGYAAFHRAVWSSARAQIVTLETWLEAQRVPFAEDVELLLGVPGVGPIVALTAIAVFSDVDRFASAKHAASYAGIIPSMDQSGNRDHHGRITHRGSTELRAMLCEAAHHAQRPDHPLHPYFRSLCVRRGYKMAVVAVAHRLCRILWAMLRHRTPFDPQKLGVERGPFAKTTTQFYRLKKSRAAIAAPA